MKKRNAAGEPPATPNPDAASEQPTPARAPKSKGPEAAANSETPPPTASFPSFVHNGVTVRTTTDGETYTAEVVRARGLTRFSRATREDAETAAREAIDHGAA